MEISVRLIQGAYCENSHIKQACFGEIKYFMWFGSVFTFAIHPSNVGNGAVLD